MALVQWRRFNFFNKQPKTSSGDGTRAGWDSIKQSLDITCSTCGRGFIIFGDENGMIYEVNHNFQVSMFKAFEVRVCHLYQLKNHNVLSAVGIDQDGVNPVIKVWNLDKKDKFGAPFCSRVQPTIPQDNVPSHVTSFVVHENLALMAVGFEQGSCILYKGDIAKDRRTNKTIYLPTETGLPITGLSFSGGGKQMFAFVATERQVMSFNLLDKSPKKNMLDQRGCKNRCSTMSDTLLSNQFITTSIDACYLYQHNSRGPCFAFEGEKVMACWYNGYLVVTYKDKAKLSMSSSSNGAGSVEKNVVTIYDMKQKLIAFSSPLPAVREVMFEWGSFYILSSHDNNLICLREIDIHHKLELLFKKNLYSLAISLAKSQEIDQEGMVDIYKQYGDHLYGKGDFDGSIAQYIKTIGHLEPSYIIRKFLDAQQISNLTSYLQVMHERGLANEDHTTLLLNCFTKLKDVDNLNNFIMTPKTALQFDVETAIRVCRQAGYYQHALQLAEKHHKHKWYLKIELEDTQRYGKALDYIKKLPFEETEKTLKQYGKVLMSSVPEETTNLLKNLCTAVSNNEVSADSAESVNPFDDDELTSDCSSGEDFIHIFVNSPDMLVIFLQHLIRMKGRASLVVYNTLLELYLEKMKRTSAQKETDELQQTTLALLVDMTRGKYDTDQALVLCQMNKFEQGILYLYESNGLYQQILRYHMETRSFERIVEACRRHGDKDAALWQVALTYLAQERDEGGEEGCRSHMAQVLEHIDRNDLLPPLLVIQLLANSPSATLALVKDYLLRRVNQGCDEIRKYEASIRECREETDKMQNRINELQTSATIFQETKCSVCNYGLELPSVHFLCQHAYHQHCFESYDENECPLCLRKNRKILDELREQQQLLSNSGEMHKQFMSQLKKPNTNGFTHIAHYFSKGLFNNKAMTKRRDDRQQQQQMQTSSVVVMDSSLQKELLMLQQS